MTAGTDTVCRHGLHEGGGSGRQGTQRITQGARARRRTGTTADGKGERGGQWPGAWSGTGDGVVSALFYVSFEALRSALQRFSCSTLTVSPCAAAPPAPGSVARAHVIGLPGMQPQAATVDPDAPSAAQQASSQHHQPQTPSTASSPFCSLTVPALTHTLIRRPPGLRRKHPPSRPPGRPPTSSGLFLPLDGQPASSSPGLSSPSSLSCSNSHPRPSPAELLASVGARRAARSPAAHHPTHYAFTKHAPHRRAHSAPVVRTCWRSKGRTGPTSVSCATRPSTGSSTSRAIFARTQARNRTRAGSPAAKNASHAPTSSRGTPASTSAAPPRSRRAPAYRRRASPAR